MKQKSTSDSSRRKFMKSAGQIVLGATVAETAVRNVSAQAGGQLTSSKVNLHPNPHAPEDEIPHRTGSEFKSLRRVPGWNPKSKQVGNHPGGKKRYLFLEEAIFQDGNKKKHPFPLTAISPPFQDAPANAWILGYPFKKKDKDNFDDLIDEILVFIRRYNADLYWMRRLHFHETETLGNTKWDPAISPPRNPWGDKNPTEPDPAKWDYKDLVEKAEDKWVETVEALKTVLSKDPSILVDTVQVNDYIVSIRVISQTLESEEIIDQNTRKTIRQIGGSSSSHISISSAFSSS